MYTVALTFCIAACVFVPMPPPLPLGVVNAASPPFAVSPTSLKFASHEFVVTAVPSFA